MKLHEAIAEAEKRPTGEVWFRPADWKGSGRGYVLRDDMVCMVPGGTGARPGITCVASWLAGDWEVVDPDQVLQESP